MSAKLGKFEEVVLLSLLSLKSESYGRVIKDEIQKKTGQKTSIGAIYTTLIRLEDKGYVSSKKGDATPMRGGKQKRLFKIEALGRKAVIDSQKEAMAMWKGLRAGAY